MRNRFLPFPCLRLVQSGTASRRVTHPVRRKISPSVSRVPRASAVFSAASVVAAVDASAAIAASAAGGAVLAAAFGLQERSASSVFDLLFPVAALLFDVLSA